MFCKDAKPNDTIKKIHAILRQAGFEIEEVSWKHPAPYIWSVHIRDRQCHFLFSNGKGISRPLALASALGEFMERLNTGYFFSHHMLTGLKARGGFHFFPDEKWFPVKGRRLPKEILDPRLYAFYDPEKELTAHHLIDRISGRGEICAVPFTRVRDGKTVYFPLSLLDNLYASNGMAAGNTFDEACVQALSEVIERYVKNRVISEGLTLPEVPKRYYARYSKVTAAIEALKAKGFGLRVQDASLGGKYPVISIVLIDRIYLRCFFAFGAHPSFEVALTRTLTELLQGQDLNHFNGFQKPCDDFSIVSDHANLEAHFIDSSGLVSWNSFKRKADFPFRFVNHDCSRQGELDYLISLIHRVHKDIYIADFSGNGFAACRIVVPDFSEIYPVGDLVYANNNRGRKLNTSVMRLPELEKRELRGLLREMETSSIRDDESVCHVIGMAVDDSSPWTQLSFGELKMLIQLTLNMKNHARKQLMWCLDTGFVRETQQALYECLSLILDKKEKSIDLSAFFDAALIKRARGYAQGSGLIHDLFDKKGNPFGMHVHHRLQLAFSKAQKMRKKNNPDQ